MKDKEILLEAIDNYDALNPSHRKILNILVDLAIDGTVITNTDKLSKLAGCTRAFIYKVLDLFKEQEFIEVIKKDKSRLNTIILKPNKLKEVVRHYQAEEEAKKISKN